MSNEEKEAFYAELTPPDTPETEVCDYLVVHPDGTLDRARGSRRAIAKHLKKDQTTVNGEMGAENLVDMPSVNAFWMAPYDCEQLDENPVANHMIQVFDSVVEVPGECRGDVIFAPAIYRGLDVEEPLSGHRLDLVLEIYAEVRSDLAAGRTPRACLHPSEMAIASRNLSPEQASEEARNAVWGVATEDVSQVMREYEEQVRANTPAPE
ncbi:hypothetical protein ABZ249_11225 [Nocardiopsis sp. NPDC006139]|uniref:hypothetical protein n=1 Tax=Nocardiopsis sp. NPDC006139 TaxID=3154578 RepID=UPI0033AB4336